MNIPDEMMTTEALTLILKLRQVDRKFRIARKQVLLLNDRIRETLVRYERASRDGRRAIRNNRRLQVYIVEAVRNMFHEYAKRQCQAIDELQDALIELTGSAYDDFEDFDD